MRRPNRFFTVAERELIWTRWRTGEPFADIARALASSPVSVRKQVLRTGGFPPRPRKRNEAHLTPADREEISRGLSCGLSIRAVALNLTRPPSTISREVARNGGRSAYRATAADKRALLSAKRPKACKLSMSPCLRRRVVEKLRRRWSPEQIAGWLKLQNPGDVTMQVSHETIYQSLFIQTRGVLKAELLEYLRSQRSMRRARPARKVERRGGILDAVSIRERPAEAEDRAIPGHWEGDLLEGTRGNFIATLVERSSRFTVLVRVPSKMSVVDAIIKQTQKMPNELWRSLTWDRGHELAQHKRFTLETDIQVYFCDPRSPWQRGSNENTNGLLRQYFPKGQDVSGYSQAQLNRVARELNQRPRKTLSFRTPAETLHEALP